ncbi:hypothetical protein DSO57_1001513 [Entomophthora muscae]|uniref:Uncharacterized protein n=1 Tax=Entomophthora muscae TaxID=34485 RepID=A0ACC2UU97_9FUNG|nr:hypothetical protein DSO57_1001513 [Entomophthora muscae]
MNLWFKKILPYLVLVIFHLNSGQVDNQATDPSRDQPSEPPQALYCPPGAPFGPVHFTKYPPNPAYAKFNLENILLADPLARTRETKTICREGKWYVRPPRLFKDKYNYLPAYFVPMTPPVTPRPDRPLEPTAAAKTASTQLFGVLYITLTGLVDSMVPNSGPWFLLGQSISYIIKLAPILWWALPAGLAAPHPKPPNASNYDWIPDSNPRTLTQLDVLTTLCLGITITTITQTINLLALIATAMGTMDSQIVPTSASLPHKTIRTREKPRESTKQAKLSMHNS